MSFTKMLFYWECCKRKIIPFLLLCLIFCGCSQESVLVPVRLSIDEIRTQRALVELLMADVRISDILIGQDFNTLILTNGDEAILSNITPIINIGGNGYWFINCENTGVLYNSRKEINITIGTNRNWIIDGKDTGIKSIVINNQDAQYIISFVESFSSWTLYMSDGSSMMIEKEDPGTDLVFTSSRQYGKRLASFGGSVCFSANICREYWRQKLELDIKNYAVPGAGFATSSNTIMEQVEMACKEGDFDIYLFWCSTNDLGASPGTVDDCYKDNDLNTSTQCGGINWCLKKIFKVDPSAKVIFFTSLKQFGPFGYSIIAESDHTYLFQLVDKQIECCNKSGIPYLDQFYNCPFNALNYQFYYNDNTHPNELGYKKIMRRQALFIAEAF